MWVCAVGDGGGAKLYPVSPGYWIVVDVFLPWMIILPVGKTKACCATSWHSALSSFPCHLLPSVTLCPRSPFSFQLPSFQPSLARSERLEMRLNNTKRQCSIRMGRVREVCPAWSPLRIDLDSVQGSEGTFMFVSIWMKKRETTGESCWLCIGRGVLSSFLNNKQGWLRGWLWSRGRKLGSWYSGLLEKSLSADVYRP